MTKKTAKDLVTEASKDIQTLSAEEALKLMGDPDMVFVDVREGDLRRASAPKYHSAIGVTLATRLSRAC